MPIFKKIDRKKNELFSFKASDHCFCCRLYVPIISEYRSKIKNKNAADGNFALYHFNVS